MHSLGLTLLAFTLTAWPAAASAMTVPNVIEGVSLTNDAAIKLDPRDGSKRTVVVFLSARCPCSMSHEAGLAALAREYSNEVRFVGVHSNADETTVESREHFKKSALPFPVIQDDGARIADSFGALKTPHVYVLAQNGDVLFQGGVDDSHQAGRAKRPYLKAALQALHEGHAPSINLARSIGCIIRR